MYKEEFSSTLKYPLDTFQSDAIDSIIRGNHVLVCAHTGSGKTIVALFTIFKALKEKQKVIYCTPVKSLSNQKYLELKELYGIEQVGILTGDIKLNDHAPILVMTTEILCNNLAMQTNVDFHYVIFDEAHYICDESRGHVWEESICLLDDSIPMIFLSATMANPEKFSKWIEDIKRTKKCPIVKTKQRPVPLSFYVFVPDKVFDENQTWEDACEQGYVCSIQQSEQSSFEFDKYQQFMKKHKTVLENSFDSSHLTTDQGRPGVAEKYTERRKKLKKQPFNMLSKLNAFVNFLDLCSHLPAIFFSLSRARCHELAEMIQGNLIDHHVQKEIEKTFDFYIKKIENWQSFSQIMELKALLLKGVAIHHSGLIPLLKEIVEILFSKGLVKVIFATETLAIGVNTPTKVVCFLDITKPCEFQQTKRILKTEEFKQMAGRAGRRGYDKQGKVIYFPIKSMCTGYEFNYMVNGNLAPIQSKFRLDSKYVIRSLLTYDSLKKSEFSIEFSTFVTNALQSTMSFSEDNDELEAINFELQEILTNSTENNTVVTTNKLFEKYYELQSLLPTLKNGKSQHKKTTKEIQSLSEQLKFEKKEKEYETYLSKKKEQTHFLEKIEKLKWQQQSFVAGDKFKTQFNEILDLQKHQNYIDSTDKATEKVKFASCINQCNELIITHVFLNAVSFIETIQKNHVQLLVFIANFVSFDKNIEFIDDSFCSYNVRQYDSILQNIQESAKYIHANFSLYENKKYLYSSYLMHLLIVENQSIDQICKENDVFEGSFMSFTQNVRQLLQELQKAFSLIQQLEWCQHLEITEKLLIEKALIFDSIYISS